MGAIRNQFYGDLPAKRWFEDQAFLKRNVVLWPAVWLNRRGVTLPPARYKEILLSVMSDVKRHGATAVVRYWPGYLMKCVQDHFAHHGEEYYKEGKSLRTLTELSILSFDRAVKQSNQVDHIRVLAMARDAMRPAALKRKNSPIAPMLPGL